MGINYLDIIISLFLFAGAIDGLLRGFLITFFNIIGLFFSLYISRVCMPYLAKLIVKNTHVYDTLSAAFVKKRDSQDTVSVFITKILDIKSPNSLNNITVIFIELGCFICIFILLTVITNLLRDTLIPSVKRGKLRYVDRLGGFVLGIIKYALLLSVFFAILIPATAVLSRDANISQIIFSSKLGEFFLKNNIIIAWFQKINIFKNPLFFYINGV